MLPEQCQYNQQNLSSSDKELQYRRMVAGDKERFYWTSIMWRKLHAICLVSNHSAYWVNQKHNSTDPCLVWSVCGSCKLGRNTVDPSLTWSCHILPHQGEFDAIFAVVSHTATEIKGIWVVQSNRSCLRILDYIFCTLLYSFLAVF